MAAVKRLMQDLAELQQSPVPAVSAAPLDDNMLEWHCNFLFDDTVYHLILFFPARYPYVSPSAEFVPKGFRFVGGATKDGKKGVQICLSIFSDFANYHTEWADEKSAGWSPGYTVQTVLLNLVSFMAESCGSSWADTISKENKKLARCYKCKDCGHTHDKPFPPLDPAGSVDANPTPKGKGKGKGKNTSAAATATSSKAAEPVPDAGPEIIDYMSKSRFLNVSPKSTDDLFGFGLIQSGPTHRPAFTTPCEYFTLGSYRGMKKAVGKVQSIMKDQLSFFLPMYITPTHGEAIKKQFEDVMKELSQVLPGCKKLPVDEMVMKTIPNLMSATVVEYSKGTQHTSDNSLNGYFALHRLFLWAVKEYPELEGKIHQRLKNFIDEDQNRSKKACPHIGEWLMLLSGASKYTWQDAANAYLSESWRRNVMWYIKDVDAKLGYLDLDQKTRLDMTLNATAVSRKLLAFQVLFLDIAMPKNMTRDQIIQRYDDNFGLPTPEMVAEMKQAVNRINNMKSYSDWFKVLKLPVPSDKEIFQRLVDSVEYAINVDGYHWTFWKTGGGWGNVLRKYKDGTPRAAMFKAMAPPKKSRKGGDAAEGSSKKTAGKEEPMEVDEEKKGGKKRKAEEEAGRGRGRGRGGAAGRGKKAKVEEESEEEEEEKEVKKGRGGGGRGARGGAARGRGRGRGRGKGK